MTTLAAHLGQIALITVAVLVVVAAGTWLLNRRRRDVWRDLAGRRGLTFSERSDGPRIQGLIRGRSVAVTIDDTSSDRDIGGVEVVRLTVSLWGVPHGMSAEGVPGLIGDLAALAEDRIAFEPEEFNRDVLVQGDEPAARSYWSDRRKDVFLELVRTAPCDQVIIRDGQLAAELREIVSERERLEQLLDQLLAAAIVLDEPVAQRDHDE